MNKLDKFWEHEKNEGSGCVSVCKKGSLSVFFFFSLCVCVCLVLAGVGKMITCHIIIMHFILLQHSVTGKWLLLSFLSPVYLLHFIALLRVSRATTLFSGKGITKICRYVYTHQHISPHCCWLLLLTLLLLLWWSVLWRKCSSVWPCFFPSVSVYALLFSLPAMHIIIIIIPCPLSIQVMCTNNTYARNEYIYYANTNKKYIYEVEENRHIFFHYILISSFLRLSNTRTEMRVSTEREKEKSLAERVLCGAWGYLLNFFPFSPLLHVTMNDMCAQTQNLDVEVKWMDG